MGVKAILPIAFSLLFFNKLIAFDLETWVSGPELPSPAHQSEIVVYNDFVYILGGCGANVPIESPRPFDTVYRLKATDWLSGWVKCESLPEAMDSPGATIDQGFIFATNRNGASGNVYSSRILLDGTLTPWNEVGISPLGQTGGRAMVKANKNCLYIFGGLI